MADLSSHPVFLVMLIAVAATLLAEIPIGFRLPVMVLEMVFGMVIGPHGLGLLKAEGLIGWLGGTAGALGEFGPVVVMSVVLTSAYGHWQEFFLLLVFVAIAFSAAFVALRVKTPPKVVDLLTRTMHSSAQLPVLLSILLLTSLLVLSFRSKVSRKD